MLLTCCSLTAVSQHGRFHSGLLVTAQGDTLNGFIHYKKNAGQLDSIFFRETLQSEITAFAWHALKYYGTPGKDDHVVCTVKRTLEYIDQFTYNIMLPDSVRVETIPLTAVYSGKKFSLYKYSGPVDYYFLGDGVKVIQLVQTYRYLTNVDKLFYAGKVPRYFIHCKYRGQLYEFYDFNADEKLKNLLEITDYKEDQLKTLISKMDKKSK